MPILIIAPVECPSSSSGRSSAHLHCCAHRVPILIVAPVECPSSSPRLSRTHLHRRTRCTPIFLVTSVARSPSSLRPFHTHLHHRAHRVLISLSHPSRAHLHRRAVKQSHSLRHCALSFILPSCSELHLFIVPLCAHLSINSYEFQCFTDQLAYIFITHNLVATMFCANFFTSEQFFKYATLH